MISIEIDMSDMTTLTKQFEQLVNVRLPNVTQVQALEGAHYAASIAPRRTGALIQAISFEKKGAIRDARGRFAGGSLIVSRTPSMNNPRGVPYHYWLETGRLVNVRGGRTQRYMQATADWINERFYDKVSNEINKSLK